MIPGKTQFPVLEWSRGTLSWKAAEMMSKTEGEKELAALLPTMDLFFVGSIGKALREKMQMTNFLPRKVHWLCSTPVRKNHPSNLHGRVWRYFYDRKLGFMCKGTKQASEIVLPSAAL